MKEVKKYDKILSNLRDLSPNKSRNAQISLQGS